MGSVSFGAVDRDIWYRLVRVVKSILFGIDRIVKGRDLEYFLFHYDCNQFNFKINYTVIFNVIVASIITKGLY